MIYGWLVALLLLSGGAMWLKVTLNDNAALKARYEKVSEMLSEADERTKLEASKNALLQDSFNEYQRRVAAVDAALRKARTDYERLENSSKAVKDWGDVDVPQPVIDWMRVNEAGRDARRSPSGSVANTLEQRLPDANKSPRRTED